jgi:hypothetical protein
MRLSLKPYFTLGVLVVFVSIMKPTGTAELNPGSAGALLPPAQDEQPGPRFDSPLLLPDLQALPPADLEIDLQPDGKRYLRLSVSVINRGTGALELLGESDWQLGMTSVTQNIYTVDGDLLEFPVGSFVFHPSHGHWHLENFARYELLSLTYGGIPKDVLTQNDKVSFCLRDLDREPTDELVVGAAYTECGKRLQGLSLGWLDTYRYHLAGQFIDISNVPDGYYSVRVTFDPEDLLLEGKETNNSGKVYLQIAGEELRVIDDPSVFKVLLDPRIE